jgi:LAO/AO transport system kinase
VISPEEITSGSKPALARLITLLENRSPVGIETLDKLFAHGGNAHLIGITGPSGSGKSTLVNRLALQMLENGVEKIGILAVDPTSPFSGGAVLGDRVRMRELTVRPEIFIRSMATRGALGGLAEATFDAALAMEAAGYNPIIIETVGAGQSEVEIAKLAHTTVVVEAPGLGDDIQAAKAGLMEVADVLVMNKSDKPAAVAAANSLRAMLTIADEVQAVENPGWSVPLLQTSALDGSGVPELVEAIRSHAVYLRESGDWQRKEGSRLLRRLEGEIRARLYQDWEGTIGKETYETIRQQVAAREISPHEALRRMFG